MTVKRVKDAAYIRGIYFDGEKKWINSTVGTGYMCRLPDGGFACSDTLDGMYKMIMKHPVITR